MKIYNLRINYEDRKIILTASVQFHNAVYEIFYAYSERFKGFINKTYDPFLAALLIPAMKEGEDIEIVGDISKKLLENTKKIQDIFQVWFPGVFRRIKIIPQKTREDNIYSNKQRVSASFFSMGIDSFYTLLKEDSIRYLVFIKGLELPLFAYEKIDFSDLEERLNEIASHYNKELIIGETNIRDVFRLNYEDYHSGGCLSSVALSISGQINNFFIPSSFSYSFSPPSGSSIQTDYLYSTEYLQLIHHGCESTRVSKTVDYVAKDLFALNNIRVCINNDGHLYNCGRCRKCISAMLTLEMAGKLENCMTLPNDIPNDYFLHLIPYNKYKRYFLEELIEYTDKTKKKDVSANLRQVINFADVLSFKDKNKEIQGGVLTKLLNFYLFKFKYLIKKKRIEKQEESEKRNRIDLSDYYSS